MKRISKNGNVGHSTLTSRTKLLNRLNKTENKSVLLVHVTQILLLMNEPISHLNHVFARVPAELSRKQTKHSFTWPYSEKMNKAEPDSQVS